jgi:hypothetical protein
MSTHSRADVVRRAGLVVAAAAPVAALAVAYGFHGEDASDLHEAAIVQIVRMRTFTVEVTG